MELSIYRNPGVSLNRPVASAGKPLVRAEVTGDNLKRVRSLSEFLVEQMLKAVQPGPVSSGRVSRRLLPGFPAGTGCKTRGTSGLGLGQ